MGNTESSVESSLSRSGSAGTAGVHRNHSPSPSGHRRTGSCRKAGEKSVAETLRRSKSCRPKEKLHRRAVCMTTGLTLHQKALLTRKWNRMDRATVYELGRLMFESVFRECPQYLVYIDLKDEPNWANHINFKIHVQRFVTALVECMRRLKEPSSACDILRDFGALYANQNKRVSAQFFERLANALNKAAAVLQEADHQQVEKTENRLDLSGEPVEWNRSSPSNSTTTSTLSVTTTLPTVRSASTMQEDRQERRIRPLVSRHSETHIELNRTRKTSRESSNCCSSEEAICPITTEAWVVLSAFLANQIKLGYELERMLKNEMSKLGLDGITLVAPSSALDVDISKRPVHA